MIDLPRIMRFATQAHDGQMYGDFPYVAHLIDVYGVMMEFGIKEPEILAAGWMHDIIEDTQYNYNDVVKVSNTECADIVYAVTDELGKNRKERHDKTWPKIAELGLKALTVKQCDLLANTRMGLKEDNRRMINMYRKEYEAFKRYFITRVDGSLFSLWEALDNTILKDSM